MKKYYGIIYCARNKINGKRYIGQTIRDLKARIKKHYKEKTDFPFFRALKKYNKKYFTWRIVKKCKTLSELNKYERYYIKKFKTRNRKHGYNVAPGGGGYFGKKHSKKHSKEIILKIKRNTRRAMNNSKVKKRVKRGVKKYWSDPKNHRRVGRFIKKLWKNKAFRKRLKKIHHKRMLKLWRNKKYRKKITSITKRRWKDKKDRKNMLKGLINWTPERRKRQSNLMKKYCKKHKKIIRKNMLKKWKDPKFRKKMKLAKRKSRIKNKNATKKLWKDPIYREKCLKARKAYFRNKKLKLRREK